jgi:hypothetical protein
MPKRKMTSDPELAAEAKSIVALAFRNGPIEDVHAGKKCLTCAGKSQYSHITQTEMKNIMKQAVDTVYMLLWLKQNEPEKYEAAVAFGNLYTRLWDEPIGDVGRFFRTGPRDSDPLFRDLKL